jgi:hypothetical protein
MPLYRGVIHVTLTDDYLLAQAFVAQAFVAQAFVAEAFVVEALVVIAAFPPRQGGRATKSRASTGQGATRNRPVCPY